MHHWKPSAADSLACTMAASDAERPTLAQTLSVSKASTCSQQPKGLLVCCLRLSAGMQQTGQPRPHSSNYISHYQGHGEHTMVRNSQTITLLHDIFMLPDLHFRHRTALLRTTRYRVSLLPSWTLCSPATDVDSDIVSLWVSAEGFTSEIFRQQRCDGTSKHRLTLCCIFRLFLPRTKINSKFD